MGAGRGRLARQLLTENVLIAATGGMAALLLAQWTRQLLIAMAGTDIPRIADTVLDQRALLFTATVALVTGVVFGMVPVVTAGRVDLVTALKAGGRTVGGDARRGLRAERAGGWRGRIDVRPGIRGLAAGAQPRRRAADDLRRRRPTGGLARLAAAGLELCEC